MGARFVRLSAMRRVWSAGFAVAVVGAMLLAPATARAATGNLGIFLTGTYSLVHPVQVTPYLQVGTEWVAQAPLTLENEIRISGMTVGSYRFRIDDPSGWYRSGWMVPSSRDGRSVVDLPEDATIFYLPTTGVGFSIDVPGSGVIEGRVVDSVTGDPLPLIPVETIGVVCGGLPYSSRGAGLTDVNGEFRLFGLTPDDYWVVTRTSKSGRPGVTFGRDSWQSTGTVIAIDSSTTTDVVLPVGTMGQLAGVALHADGTPVINAYVTTTDRNPGPWSAYLSSRTRTDATGHYALASVYPGPCVVTVEGGTASYDTNSDGSASVETTCVSDELTTVPEIIVPEVPHITGTITMHASEYSATGYTIVEAWRRAEDGSYSLAKSIWAPSTGGAYAFRRLPAGTYRLVFRPHWGTAVWWPAATSMESAQDIVLGAEEGAVADVELRRKTRLGGTILSVNDGQILAVGFGVTATLWEGRADGSWVPTASAHWASGDTWEMAGDFEGTYRITINDQLSEYASLGWPAGTDVSSAQDLTLSRGMWRTIDSTMTPLYSPLTITAVGACWGERVPGAVVQLWKEKRIGAGLILEATGVADENGVATFASVSPATYRVYVTDPSGERLEGRNYTVEVMASTPAADVVTLMELTRVEGVVADARTRRPLGGMKVVATTGPTTSLTTYTDSEGRYRFGGIWDAITVTVSDPKKAYVTRSEFTGDVFVGYKRQIDFALTPTTSVGIPVGPRSVGVRRLYHVWGTFAPKHAPEKGLIRLYVWHLEGGKLVAKGYVDAPVNAETSRYECSLRFAQPGRWQIRAFHPATDAHPAAWSPGFRVIQVD